MHRFLSFKIICPCWFCTPPPPSRQCLALLAVAEWGCYSTLDDLSFSIKTRNVMAPLPVATSSQLITTPWGHISCVAPPLGDKFFLLCIFGIFLSMILWCPRWFYTPFLRQCLVLFAVAKGWLLLDIGWFVLFFLKAENHGTPANGNVMPINIVTPWGHRSCVAPSLREQDKSSDIEQQPTFGNRK